MSGERIRLGRLAESVRRGVAPAYADSGRAEIVNQACVYQSGLQLEKVKYQDDAVALPEKARIKREDILVNSTGTSTLGRVAFVDFEPENLFADGHVSILRITDPRALPKYIFYKLYDAQDYFENALAKGATNQIELSPKAIESVEVILPPLSEQRAIVRYLDAKLAQIDQFIANKRRLIELLQEQKQVIVNRYVTRGLDEHADLKDSGLEWLGQVPKHWETRRIRYLFREVVDTGYTDLPLLSITRDYGVIPKADSDRSERYSDDLTNYKRAQVGDICYNVLNARIGSLGRSDYDGLLSPAYAVARARDISEVDSTYYHYLFRTPRYVDQFRLNSLGIVEERLRLYFQEFSDIWTVIPPLSEQRAIVARIEEETAALARAVAHAEREIELIGEYRTTLISEAVTGKIDVREWDGG